MSQPEKPAKFFCNCQKRCDSQSELDAHRERVHKDGRGLHELTLEETVAAQRRAGWPV